ncbi:hypothetical protein L7F22_022529 [Adiantum nelumboides]|nr:hypothetical protein [Adiantum nelumboides]
MEDFEVPSFSLGLDEEITTSPRGCAAVSHASNPFKTGIKREFGSSTYKYEAPIQTLNREAQTSKNKVSNPVYDSDFELPPPISTPRVLKRLQRKSGHSVLGPPHLSQDVHNAGLTNTSEELFLQNLSSNELKKTSSPKKALMTSAAGSKGRTLPNFWKGLDCKLAKGSPATFCSKVRVENGIGSAGQSLNNSDKLLTRINERKLGISQSSKVVKLGVMGKGSTELAMNNKASNQEGCAGHEKEELSKVQLDLKDSSADSVQHSIEDMMCDRLATEDVRQGLSNLPFGMSGNSLHDQQTSLYASYLTCEKDNLGKSFRKGLGHNKSNGLDDSLHGLLMENNEPPLQSLSRSSADKEERLPSPSPAACVLGGGNSVNIFQTTSKQKSLDCPTNAYLGANSNPSKTTALQSFWKSLNEKKLSTRERVNGVKEDDIENCSTDDDFDFGSQPTRKLSLCGNNREGNVAADRSSLQNINQCLSNDTSISPNYGIAFCFSPKSSLVDGRANLSSTLPSAVCFSFVKPGTSQTFVAVDAAQTSSAQCHIGTKQRAPLNKASVTTNMIDTGWQCSNDDKEDNLLAFNAFDKRQNITPTKAYQANVLGGESVFSVDPVSQKDPRIANLLRRRFPHFLPVSALTRDKFAGTEQVYIDYENQFSGGKANACPLVSTTLKQSSARSTSKGRKLAQKNQKNAMADNDGWIQTGNRMPARIHKSSQSGGHCGSQARAYSNTNSSAGPGYWVTERTGKRIYVTKDGRKLSGSSAYRQHSKVIKFFLNKDIWDVLLTSLHDAGD